MSWCAESPKSPAAASSHPVRQSQAGRRGPAPSRAPAFALHGQAAPSPFLRGNLLFMGLQSRGEAEHRLLPFHPSHDQELSAAGPSPTSAAAGEPSHPLEMAA